MDNHGSTWALVLAAGDGQRRRSVTAGAQDIGVPMQYCSPQGEPSLLDAALRRALTIATPERVCAVVAEHHRHWWSGVLAGLPENNVIVQPENRGTAIGILLPLLHILQRDPDARIVLLPSDHHVRDESILARSMRRAARHIHAGYSDLLLLGLEPEDADTDLGYIMPGFSAGACTFQVASFIEKPAVKLARELIERGALWNAFIVVAKGRALLQMFDRKYGDIVAEMRDAVRRCGSHVADPEVLDELYVLLPPLDFSRDIVEGQEANLQVLAVQSCGWNDLGTPERVQEALRRATRGRPDSPQTGENDSYSRLAYSAGMVS